MAGCFGYTGVPFAFFALAMVAQLIIVTAFFPETKRVELEEMERALGQA